MFDSFPNNTGGFVAMAVLITAGFYGPLLLGAKLLKRALNGPEKRKS